MKRYIPGVISGAGESEQRKGIERDVCERRVNKRGLSDEMTFEKRPECARDQAL